MRGFGFEQELWMVGEEGAAELGVFSWRSSRESSEPFLKCSGRAGERIGTRHGGKGHRGWQRTQGMDGILGSNSCL